MFIEELEIIEEIEMSGHADDYLDLVDEDGNDLPHYLINQAI